MSAAADALQLDNAVRLSCFPKRRGGDVINGNAGGSFALEKAVVSVAVENSIDFEAIDWLFQSAGAEKRVYLGIFAFEGGADWRVV